MCVSFESVSIVHRKFWRGPSAYRVSANVMRRNAIPSRQAMRLYKSERDDCLGVWSAE